MPEPITLTPVAFDDYQSPVTLHPSTMTIPEEPAPVPADGALEAETANEAEPAQTTVSDAPASTRKNTTPPGAGKG